MTILDHLQGVTGGIRADGPDEEIIEYQHLHLGPGIHETCQPPITTGDSELFEHAGIAQIQSRVPLTDGRMPKGARHIGLTHSRG